MKEWFKKLMPSLLAVTAGAGVVGTAVLAAKATPKAIERKEEAEKEKGEPLTGWEKVKVMAPCYIPAAGTGVATIGAIGAMAVSSSHRQAELGGIIAGSNQIINRIGRKYTTLREEVKKKDPEIIQQFDQESLDDKWNEYVKERINKRVSCGCRSFPDCSGEAWGEKRMFGIEYGNGLVDENGNEYIFFEATPGDVVTAFYNLNGLYKQNGMQYVNNLFRLLSLPKTDLGSKLIWDPIVLWEEWESDYISFHTEDLTMEDDLSLIHI